MGKTLVAIGAHFDDIEIGAGGTIAKYIQEGWRVLYVIATTTPHYARTESMEQQTRFYSNEEIINIRKDEAKAGAKILGISEEDVIFFDLKSQYWYEEGTYTRRYLDGEHLTAAEFEYLSHRVPGREYITYAHKTISVVNRLMELLDDHEASIVLTQKMDDPHLEHYAVALWVFTAVNNLVNFGMPIDLYGWGEADARYPMNSFAPTHYIDITETLDIKCKSLEVFKSQFKDENPTFFVEVSRKRAEFYGQFSGFRYAEAFMKYDTRLLDSNRMVIPITYDPSKSRNKFDERNIE